MVGEVAAFAPGRVNLLGEHTDYNEGLALAFAIEAGVVVRGRREAGSTVRAIAEDLGEEDAFELGSLEPGDGWRAFVRGAVGELLSAGVPVPPAQLWIRGSVARGAGLSSSAALAVALVLALLALAERPEGERTDLARLCARIENSWVGAQTGLLDQLASLYGERGHALRIDFRTLELRQAAVRLPGHRFVTLDSGEARENAGSAYNMRRAECAKACELLGVPSLRQATEQMADELPEPLNRRVRHVLGANRRVEEALSALAREDSRRLGELLDEAHTSLRELYEVSTPALEAAVRGLKEAGALGARVIGGGFGGSVLGLAPAGARLPEGAIEVVPGPGAHLLSRRLSR